jgi:hypothetical protein
MAAIIVPNTTEANVEDLEPPTKDDGNPYRYEMLFNASVDRAYADTTDELLACLIPQYLTMTEGERMAARLSHAVRTQVSLQADINWEHANLTGCSPEEVAVLAGDRTTPPEIRAWSSAVPLVLVDVFYQPTGALPRPFSTVADVANPPNIFWLTPADGYDYISSLSTLGFIEVHLHSDFLE